MENEDLGYNSFFEANKNQLGLSDFPVARVIAEFRESYRAGNADGKYLAKITGKQIFESSGREDFPAIGDWVAIEIIDNNHTVIRAILPRQTIFKRKYRNKTQIIAANIDIAFVIESADRDFNLNRFERYFSIAKNGGVKPAIILNKIDLLSKEESVERFNRLKNRFPGIDIIFTSATSNEGLDNLKKYIIKGKTYCFLGSSGVGKSSLINKLLGKDAIKTGNISSYSGRGKHITTSRQMYFLSNGGIVIDNPGLREIGMADTGQGINLFFNEIAVLAQKCKYTDCAHAYEPGCVVLEAVKSGRLDKEKYANYVNLRKEAEHCAMDNVKKREKDRRFGKFKKTAMKELKKYGHKDL